MSISTVASVNIGYSPVYTTPCMMIHDVLTPMMHKGPNRQWERKYEAVVHQKSPHARSDLINPDMNDTRYS